MELYTHTLILLAVIGLGLMTGALLAEGAVLVPFWRASPPEDFLAWYRKHADLLQHFFAPLELGAAGATIFAAVAAWMTGSPAIPKMTVASMASLAVLVVFPLYFQQANAGFRTGHIRTRTVAHELLVWSRWHWLRTALSLGAFGAAASAL